MEPIHQGMAGAAVEDVQTRLISLGYTIDESEQKKEFFGASTADAVRRFRAEYDLPTGSEIDTAAWVCLVDETYEMGDRTLYLRLPSFHGADVRKLQRRLNILGFFCGCANGYYDVYTEAAVKQFQESVGIMADGMAFQDTFDAIERLHHVWEDRSADGLSSSSDLGFARAASVLSEYRVALTAVDPISRNVAGRVWNLAYATTEDSSIRLLNTPDECTSDDEVLIVLAYGKSESRNFMSTVSIDELHALPRRMRRALENAWRSSKTAVVRVELPQQVGGIHFTATDAQTLAVMVLDALCAALSKESLS